MLLSSNFILQGPAVETRFHCVHGSACATFTVDRDVAILTKKRIIIEAWRLKSCVSIKEPKGTLCKRPGHPWRADISMWSLRSSRTGKTSFVSLRDTASRPGSWRWMSPQYRDRALGFRSALEVSDCEISTSLRCIGQTLAERKFRAAISRSHMIEKHRLNFTMVEWSLDENSDAFEQTVDHYLDFLVCYCGNLPERCSLQETKAIRMLQPDWSRSPSNQ